MSHKLRLALTLKFLQATTNQANLNRAILLREFYVYGDRYAIRFSIKKLYALRKKYLRAFPPKRKFNVFLAKKFFLKINKIRKGQIPNTIRIPARHILFINTRPAPIKIFMAQTHLIRRFCGRRHKCNVRRRKPFLRPAASCLLKAPAARGRLRAAFI